MEGASLTEGSISPPTTASLDSRDSRAGLLEGRSRPLVVRSRPLEGSLVTALVRPSLVPEERPELDTRVERRGGEELVGAEE